MQAEKSPKSNFFSKGLSSLRGTRSKAEFARFLGIPAPMYQRYEDGRIPRSDILAGIAAKCGVTVEQLLSGNAPAPQDTAAFWQAKASELEAKLDAVNEAMSLILEGVKLLQKAMKP